MADLEELWGDVLTRQAAAVALKRDIHSPNGDLLLKGTQLQIQYLGRAHQMGKMMCRLVLPIVGKSGRDYTKTPLLTRIMMLPTLVTGFRDPGIVLPQKWLESGVSITPSGRRVPPGGWAPDGSPSWLLVLGLV